MERLSFDSNEKYNSIELAIHLARYSIIQNLCSGKKVLDVACGEGYGSYTMATKWGADSVVGVDVSQESINSATKLFARPNVEFVVSPAEEIDKLFSPESFDIIISLETIEHLDNPVKFLTAIKSLVKPEGIVIISCPNDHWYYGPGPSQNPYHIHTYYFEEFKKQAEDILGNAAIYLFGRPINGFGNFALDDLAIRNMPEGLENARNISAQVISNESSPSIEKSSYFVGIWGEAIGLDNFQSGVILPISMDDFSLSLIDEKNIAVAEKEAIAADFKIAENLNAEFKTQLDEARSRILELENWAIDLQNVISKSEAYIVELKEALSHCEKDSEEKQKLFEDQISNKDSVIAANHSEISNLTLNLQEKTDKINSLENTISVMEESNFWKLRNNWVNLKGKVSSSDKE